jgi:ABC-2 type transport system permease protein
MTGAARYLRLFAALGRFGLAREMAFRGNFLIKVTVEVLWLVILLVFYRTVFSKTDRVAGWSEPQFLFFVGCYYTLGSLIETFFLSNCSEFADLIRSGDLDFILLKPIDEQFLVSCRSVEWSTVPNVVLGGAVMGFALYEMGWAFDAVQALLFVLTFAAGLAIAYGFLLLLTSSAVWLVRNQSLWELWWLFSSLMRYPREVFTRTLAAPVGWFFWYVVPIMLVSNVPARVMIDAAFDPWNIAFTMASAAALLAVSRLFFRYALRRYRSASS